MLLCKWQNLICDICVHLASARFTSGAVWNTLMKRRLLQAETSCAGSHSEDRNCTHFSLKCFSSSRCDTSCTSSVKAGCCFTQLKMQPLSKKYNFSCRDTIHCCRVCVSVLSVCLLFGWWLSAFHFPGFVGEHPQCMCTPRADIEETLLALAEKWPAKLCTLPWDH